MSENKPRRLTRSDKEYIKAHCLIQTDEEIAKYLNVSRFTITRYRKRIGVRKKNRKIQSVGDEVAFDQLTEVERIKFCKIKLQKSPAFEELKMMFNEDEIKKYVRKWSHYFAQFQSELTATEESQIDQLVKFEILMDKNLIDKRGAEKDIQAMEHMYNLEMQLDESLRDTNKILQLTREIANIRASQIARTTEYSKLQGNCSKILADLKATRQQRVKDDDDSKKSFFNYVRYVQDHENQLREARQIELLKMASRKKAETLGEYHTFQDGSIDRIILNSETVQERTEE